MIRRGPGAIQGGGAVILAPHPDDEIIGCGGLIAEGLRRRRPLLVVLATDGGASHEGSPAWPRARRAAWRQREMLFALRRLGGGRRHLRALGLPDGAMPESGTAFRTALAGLCRAVRRVRARVIIAPSRVDAHRDHRACFGLAAAAARRCHAVVAEYGVWGALPRQDRYAAPSLRHAYRRTAALACHRSQMGRGPRGFGAGFTVPTPLRAQLRRGQEHYVIAWRQP